MSTQRKSNVWMWMLLHVVACNSNVANATGAKMSANAVVVDGIVSDEVTTEEITKLEKPITPEVIHVQNEDDLMKIVDIINGSHGFAHAVQGADDKIKTVVKITNDGKIAFNYQDAKPDEKYDDWANFWNNLSGLLSSQHKMMQLQADAIMRLNRELEEATNKKTPLPKEKYVMCGGNAKQAFFAGIQAGKHLRS